MNSKRNDNNNYGLESLFLFDSPVKETDFGFSDG